MDPLKHDIDAFIDLVIKLSHFAAHGIDQIAEIDLNLFPYMLPAAEYQS